MEPSQEKTSTIRQVATNTGRIAAGNPESPLTVDGLEQRQNNKPITAALWMADSLRSMAVLSSRAQERRSRVIRARSAREGAAKPREK